MGRCRGRSETESPLDGYALPARWGRPPPPPPPPPPLRPLRGGGGALRAGRCLIVSSHSHERSEPSVPPLLSGEGQAGWRRRESPSSQGEGCARLRRRTPALSHFRTLALSPSRTSLPSLAPPLRPNHLSTHSFTSPSPERA